MNIKTSIVVVALLGAFTIPVKAGMDLGERTRFAPESAVFNPEELSMDLFGTYGTRDRDDFSGDSLGLGIGVNYFFSRYFGASADTYLEEVDWPNHLDFSFLARFPLENISLAPYGMAGFGRQFRDKSQWTTHIGIGAEFRFNQKTGLFTDVRRVFPDESKDFNLWRFGVRLTF